MDTLRAVNTGYPLRALPIKRLGTFVLVGGTCLMFQLLLLQGMIREFGLQARHEKAVANAIAFLFATQANFVLSRTVTWRDRMPSGSEAGRPVRQQLAFNLMALLGLGMSQSVFILAAGLVGAIEASALGTIAASAMTLSISAGVVFPRTESEVAGGRN